MTPQEPRSFPIDADSDSSEAMILTVFKFMGQKAALGGLVFSAVVSCNNLKQREFE